MRPIEHGITQIPSNTSTKNDTFEIDDTTILTPDKQPLLEEVNTDNMRPMEQGIKKIYLNDSDSDSDSDLNIQTSNIVTSDQQGLLKDSLLTSSDTDNVTQGPVLSNDSLSDIDTSYEDEDEDEEAFLHDAAPQLIEDLQFIEKKFKAYGDYNDITDRSVDAVKSLIKEIILGPFQDIFKRSSVGDLKALLIIDKLSKALNDRDFDSFLKMISHIKTSLNNYYNTTDSDEQENIIVQLVDIFNTEFRKFHGGSVNKQKTKKQKPLRKNNSFRKKRKAKV